MKNKEQNSEQEIIKPSYYVGIGASAGGLEALEDFFEHLPKSGGMSYMVVQHLSPDYKSMMVELLSRKTEMEICQIEDGMYAEANKIYLIPPKTNLTIYHGQLFLNEQIRNSSINLPINIFFRSLAIDQQKKAIGIILSGTGSDGTLGIKAIKEQGGLVMVQDFVEAKFDGMPKSALSTGLVDYTLSSKKMGDALVKFVSHPNVLKEEKDQADQNETDFTKILSLVRSNVAIDFSYYKPKTIIRRIERRISVNQLTDTEDYVKLLLHSKEECEILSREFLIGVTQFFRDAEAYGELQTKVIPKLFESVAVDQTIRLWSVGCSTGEEAYSIAILCNEYMENNKINADLKVFATDLDKEAIRFASSGIYAESIVADVPEEYISKYFVKKQESYQINEKIRQMVVFANHNITADPPFSKIKLVTCRNLLIYFKSEVQEKVMNMFQYALNSGGYMFLGSSESISGVADTFEVINSKWKIFKYKSQDGIGNFANFISSPDRVRNVVSGLSKISAPYEKQKDNSQADLFEKALNKISPSGVIINSENTIVHYLNDMQKYMSFPKGKPNYNFIELLNPQLTMVVSNMLFKIRKEKREINMNKFRFEFNDEILLLDINANLIILDRSKLEYIIVTIREIDSQQNNNENITTVSFNNEAALRITELERELQYRDSNLQTTNEELETSNEELQATNEELVSSNEELQSTNEELQSVNEELYTVNSQYQEKIGELTELNNDISNLLSNTKIGTLFLDSRMIIRKFTPEITKTLNVMEVDIGRPFNHITANCSYNDLYKDVEAVIETLIIKEIEVKSKNNSWYLLRIQPYRHFDNSIHGVIITQIDITSLQESKSNNIKLREAVEQSASGIIITNKNGNIEYVNNKFTEISGYSSDEVIGRNPKILKSGIHEEEFYAEMWRNITAGNHWKGALCNKRKNGEIYWENNIISAIYDSKGDIVNFLAIKEDITEKREIEERLNIKRSIIEQTKKITNSADWIYDFKTDELTWSEAVFHIFGIEPKKEKINYDFFLEKVHPQDRDLVDTTFKKSTQEHTPYKIEHRIIRPNGEIRNVIEASTEILDKDKKPTKSIGVIIDITESKNIEIIENILINKLPLGFAYCRILANEFGCPKDFLFINGNESFKEITQIDRQKIQGESIKKHIEFINEQWIEENSKKISDNTSFYFEYFSEKMNQKFDVEVFFPVKDYLVLIYKQKTD